MDSQEAPKALYTGLGCKEPTHLSTQDCVITYSRFYIRLNVPISRADCQAKCIGKRIKTRIGLLRRIKGTKFRLRLQHQKETEDLDPEKVLLKLIEDVDSLFPDDIKQFKTEHLISILNCYADFGTLLQRSNATIINTFYTLERIRRSLFRGTKPVIRPKVVFTDGVVTLNRNGIDTHWHLFERIKNSLKSTPSLSIIGKEIFERMNKEPTYIMNLLDSCLPEQDIVFHIKRILDQIDF